MSTSDWQFTTKAMIMTVPSAASEITIVPFGDIHRNSPECDVELFHKFLAEQKAKMSPERYFVMVGDEEDLISSSERDLLRKADFHESTMSTLDVFAKEKTEALAKELEFMKGHVLVKLTGNHQWPFTSGELSGKNSSDYLAELLDAPLGGFLCYLRVGFQFANRPGTTRCHLDFVLCHGKTGPGKTVGSSINGVTDLEKLFPTADVFVMGHDHQLGAVPDTYFKVQRKLRDPATLNIRPCRRLYCRTGSFLKAYEPGHAGYLVGRLCRPATLGALELKVTFERNTQTEHTTWDGVVDRRCIMDTVVPVVKAVV